MTDLPVWLQEIRDRVNAATKGPWTAEDANPHKPHKRFAFYIPAIMSAPSMPQYDGLAEEDADFIAHARTDVPRLIEMVAEMAKVLETVQDTCKDLAREDIHCVTEACCQFIDECETVLAKYYGEVKP